ncbi:hypothetical protein [Bradyrhizobium sp. Ec3.3]|uniref:hypothetical protein n=1 Tax=unclassified Bradyrhizobium TaxID=2631580 RepID=UPI003528C44D
MLNAAAKSAGDEMRNLFRNSALLRRLYYRTQMLRARGQSDETQILDRLTRGILTKTFVEFGFHPVQFNCIGLAQNPDWHGLLVDGNARQIADARAILPDRIKIEERFLTVDNLEFIKSAFPKIGVLSIDVDGNDFWFLRELIDTRPSVICVEYNSSLGLAPITVPYDPAFDRHEKHPRGWYHGASLTALAKLCAAHGYGLAEVSAAGANAFFTEGGTLDPQTAWKPNRLRESYSGVPHEEQWEAIRHLSFETVCSMPAASVGPFCGELHRYPIAGTTGLFQLKSGRTSTPRLPQ